MREAVAAAAALFGPFIWNLVAIAIDTSHSYVVYTRIYTCNSTHILTTAVAAAVGYSSIFVAVALQNKQSDSTLY